MTKKKKSGFLSAQRFIVLLVILALVIIYMLRFVDAFKVFDTVYTMTNGGPGTATEMLPNYIYKQGMKYFDVGYTAALAIAFVLVMSLFTAIFLRIRRKVEERVQ